ncbi:MAG TPA: thiamine-phosphate kinase [Pyrinomonadaceae bacterium]|nr:thiamine-phosphate kinase [Pyrinomonadaceae bacterium]
MNEFEFIEKLKNKSSTFRNPQFSSRVGIGDDCAVLPKDAKTDSVTTADLLVEDIDFRLSWSKPEFTGHKALAVSLSDVAAMGAKPVWAMLSIGVPASVWKTDFVEKFYDGWFRLAKKFQVELVGGDISKTPDKIVIDSIVAGEVKKNKAVLRSGAKVGDLIFVTGNLGGAAAGLKLLEKGFSYDSADKLWHRNLLLKQLQPFPQVFGGLFLSENDLATAMIDLSDGLSSDLAHLCRASSVGARIYADKIPFHKNLCSIAKSFEEKIDYALNGGEDFELLFTVNPKKNFKAESTLKNCSFFCIGETTANAGIIELSVENEVKILQPKGFRHF